MPCPVCRKEFTIPEEGFEGLQKNFFMERLIDMIAIVKPSSSGFHSDCALSQCEACREDSDPTAAAEASDDIPSADMYCTDCQMKLCINCCKHHSRSTLTKSHKLLTINVGNHTMITGEQLETVCPSSCDRHEEEKFKIYCIDCEMVLCALCYIEKHQNHNWLDVDKAAQDFRNQIQEYLERLSVHHFKFLKEKEELEKKKSEVLQRFSKIQSEVLASRDDLKKRADEHADSLLQTSNSLKNKNEKEIEEEKDAVDHHLTILESYIAYSTEIKTKGSASDICRTVKDLSARGRELEQTYQSADVFQSKIQPLKIAFEETKLDSFLKENDDNIVGKLLEEKLTKKLQYAEELLVHIDQLEEKMDRQRLAYKALEAAHCVVKQELTNERSRVWKVQALNESSQEAGNKQEHDRLNKEDTSNGDCEDLKEQMAFQNDVGLAIVQDEKLGSSVGSFCKEFDKVRETHKRNLKALETIRENERNGWISKEKKFENMVSALEEQLAIKDLELDRQQRDLENERSRSRHRERAGKIEDIQVLRSGEVRKTRMWINNDWKKRRNISEHQNELMISR